MQYYFWVAIGSFPDEVSLEMHPLLFGASYRPHQNHDVRQHEWKYCSQPTTTRLGFDTAVETMIE